MAWFRRCVSHHFASPPRGQVADQAGPAILAGRSHGGTVITGAGLDPKVVRWCISRHSARTIATTGQYLPKGPLPTAVSKAGLAFLGAFAPDGAMATRVFVYDSQVPLAMSVFSAPITHPAWRTTPSWYIV